MVTLRGALLDLEAEWRPHGGAGEAGDWPSSRGSDWDPARLATSDAEPNSCWLWTFAFCRHLTEPATMSTYHKEERQSESYERETRSGAGAAPGEHLGACGRGAPGAGEVRQGASQGWVDGSPPEAPVAPMQHVWRARSPPPHSPSKCVRTCSAATAGATTPGMATTGATTPAAPGMATTGVHAAQSEARRLSCAALAARTAKPACRPPRSSRSTHPLSHRSLALRRCPMRSLQTLPPATCTTTRPRPGRCWTRRLRTSRASFQVSLRLAGRALARSAKTGRALARGTNWGPEARQALARAGQRRAGPPCLASCLCPMQGHPIGSLGRS